MQIQISWLLQKPTDLDVHCLLRQGMSCSTSEGLNLWDTHFIRDFCRYFMIMYTDDKFCHHVWTAGRLSLMALWWCHSMSYMHLTCKKAIIPFISLRLASHSVGLLTLVLLNPDISCICKQCRSWSFGFWRSQMIWICTVSIKYMNSYQQSGSSNLIGWKLEWYGILIYSAWQGLK